MLIVVCLATLFTYCKTLTMFTFVKADLWQQSDNNAPRILRSLPSATLTYNQPDLFIQYKNTEHLHVAKCQTGILLLCSSLWPHCFIYIPGITRVGGYLGHIIITTTNSAIMHKPLVKLVAFSAIRHDSMALMSSA